jgi:hypothetical protein
MPAKIEGAVIYHYYYFGDQAKTGENSKNVELHYFKNQDPGAFVSISGGGVLASSKHKECPGLPEVGDRQGMARTVLKTAIPSNTRSARRGIQPEAGAARRSAGAEGRAFQAEQQEGHRPDDGSRLAVMPFLLKTTDHAPAGIRPSRE